MPRKVAHACPFNMQALDIFSAPSVYQNTMPTIQVHVKAHHVPKHMVRAHNVKAYTYTRKVKARKPPARKAPARRVRAPVKSKKAPARKIKRIPEDDPDELAAWGL